MEVSLKAGPKKTAIVSYGLRITIGGANSRAVGVEYLRKYYLEVLNRSEVDIVTYKLKSEADIDYIKEIADTDLNDYDEVIIHQCVINIIGGVFKREAIQTFVKLADYRGDIWYFFGDPNLYPTDFSKFVGYKRYGDPYVKIAGKIDGKNTYDISDEFLDKWSKNVFNRMKVLFAGRDYDLYTKIYYENIGKGTYVDLGIKDIRTDCEWTYIPLYEYTNRAERLELKETDYPFENRKYDLVYYGNHRAGKRNKIISNLYDNEGLNNFVVGYDPKFKKCKYDFENYVEHDKMFELVASNAYATVVMGDTLHNNNIRTPRFYEAMHMDIVAFIWDEYDEKHQFIQNEALREFIYIKSYDELKDRLNKIKNDETLFRSIIALQRNETLNDYNFALTKFEK